MMKSLLRVSVLLMIVLIGAPGTLAQAWPDVFNPFQILTLNLQLAESDWDTIRHDLTNEIEAPAAKWPRMDHQAHDRRLERQRREI